MARIWIVEDDPQIGLLIELTVKKAGHEARRLVDGVELERALQKDAPELLLLDLMLREKDGFTLLREWKQRQRTKDVPVIGMGTDSFPAFFTPHSQYRIDYRIDDYHMVARFLKAKWELGFEGAAILSNPIPERFAIAEEVIDAAIARAVEMAKEEGIAGEKNTPFLLSKVNELTGGASLAANVEIIRNNARVAAVIAREYHAL